MSKGSVMQEWTTELSFKEQTVLISAIRGCDTVDKHDMSKFFIRRLRRAVLRNACEDQTAEFMHSDITIDEIIEFTKSIDKYPIHFILHFCHAAEIVGYCGPAEDREFFKTLYLELVNAFHMLPESEAQMHERLKDGVETICHKT